MFINRTLQSLILIALTLSASAQLDSNLYNDTEFDTAFVLSHVLKWESNGYLHFQPNSILASEVTTTYKNQFVSGTNYDFALRKTTTVPFLPDVECFKYVETYHSIPIEAADFTVIAVDDYAYSANGKVVNDIDQSLENIYSKQQALDALELAYDTIGFAWDDSLSEAAIKLDLNDPNATYYPDGELIWALEYSRHFGL